MLAIKEIKQNTDLNRPRWMKYQLQNGKEWSSDFVAALKVPTCIEFCMSGNES